jgi:spermidine synthase
LIFARAGEYPSKQQLFSKLPELILPMQSLHISIDDYLARLTREVDWNENARVLTDGYSPGNLLMHQGP